MTRESYTNEGGGPSLRDRVGGLERQRDIDHGFALATDGAVTTLLNAMREHRAETQDQHRKAMAKFDALNAKLDRQEKLVQRAQAMPLAVLAFLLLQHTGAADAATVGAPAVLAVLMFFFPEFAQKFARRAIATVGASEAPPPPTNQHHNGNGRVRADGPASDAE